MKSFIAILGMFGVAGASYGAVLFDFNTPGQLTGNFSSGQSGPITQMATGGLSNSGCLNISGTDYNNGPWQIFTLNTPFSGDLDTWRVSFYYKGNANYNPTLGVITEAAPLFTGSEPGDGVSTYYPYIVTGTGNNDGGSQGVGSFDGSNSPEWQVSPVPGGLPDVDSNWYFYEMTVSYTGSNNFSVTGTLNSAASDGSIGALLQSNSATFNNPGIAADSTAYIYFEVKGGVAIDNLSTTAVPEPTTIGMLAGAGLLAFAAYRRRVARA